MTSRQSIEREVEANILSQPANGGTVADYNLSREFLRRVADRVICESYFDRFRAVIPGPGDRPPTPPPLAEPRPCPPHAYEVLEVADTPSLPEGHPPFRAWRSEADWPTHPPPEFVALAAKVNARLATDGVVSTAILAMHELGTSRFLEGDASLLRSVGIPTDLLALFQPPGAPQRSPHDPAHATAWLARTLQETGHPARARAAAAKMEFQFVPALPGFTPWVDDGTEDAGLIRFQLTRSSDFLGEGDGGNLDLLRQLVRALPGSTIAIHLHRRDLPGLVDHLARWGVHADRIRLLVQSKPVSQWAQDNLKPGRVGDRAAAILPRFASRAEEASIFMPGDDSAAASIGRIGVTTRRSPLLFQGGNLMCAVTPDGQRVLFIGESEIARNTAIGLSPAQARLAFATEFSCNRTVVLPNASFHIDYEVSFHRSKQQLHAIVGDTSSAASAVVITCVEHLAHCGTVPGLDPSAVRSAIASRRADQLHASTSPLFRAASVPGGVSFRFAELLRVASHDSGVANARILLKALDLLFALASRGNVGVDPFADAYFESIRRREQDRTVLRAALTGAGCIAHSVPSLSEGPMSLNYLNAVSLSGICLTPCYGGLYSLLDERFRTNFPIIPSAVHNLYPLITGESQRRQGAVRCSISCFAGALGHSG